MRRLTDFVERVLGRLQFRHVGEGLAVSFAQRRRHAPADSEQGPIGLHEAVGIAGAGQVEALLGSFSPWHRTQCRSKIG